MNNISNNLNIKYHINKVDPNINTNNFLNIMCLNAQSIRNKFNDIKHLIYSYNFTIHIIVLTETFLYTNETKHFHLNNYNHYFLCREERRGGGVAIYVLKSIPSKLSFSVTDADNNFLLVNLPNKNLNVLAIYRPPNSNKSKFLAKLEEITSKNNKTYINKI